LTWPHYQVADRLAQKSCGSRVRKQNPDETLYEHACAVADRFRTEEPEWIVAILHDAVEDCGLDPIIIEMMFGRDIRVNVEMVTRREDEPYDNYIERIFCAGSDVAVRVKLADLFHDLKGAPSALRPRYIRAVRRLSEHPAGADFLLAESA
jgi:(p)ppGpp synthase/HD superfamily hydrolase